jgi:signal transduction histidine kinase
VATSLGALLLYSGLYALVHRASRTISGQQSDLQVQLARLHGLLHDNRCMNQRLQQAGAQTASMGELSLRRIAADLHDGPAQDLAIALLALDNAPVHPESAP